MSLRTRELALPPDALALASRLRSAPGLAFLWSADHAGPSYLACEPIGSSQALDPEPDLALEPSPEAHRVPRWIGLLPYEAQRSQERAAFRREPDLRDSPHLSSPIWFRYGAVARIDQRVTVIGDDEDAIEKLTARLLLPPVPPEPVRLDPIETEPEGSHLARIEHALTLIRRGEIYQVNLARRLEFACEGHPLDLLAALSAPTRPPYAALIALDDLTVVSTSPELFLKLEANRELRTSPIKGTRPRGVDSRDDLAQAALLDADPKERAELSMVIDVERNDLGRIAEVGSVRVTTPPAVRACGTVWHREATVAARLRSDLDRTALLRSMLPSGSVTGAPKIRAMEVISTLEAERRGLYTGALGFLSHDGGLSLAMAIRTLTIRGARAHYWVGGGIVAESDPAREVTETLWKATQVTRLATAQRPDP